MGFENGSKMIIKSAITADDTLRTLDANSGGISRDWIEE